MKLSKQNLDFGSRNTAWRRLTNAARGSNQTRVSPVTKRFKRGAVSIKFHLPNVFSQELTPQRSTGLRARTGTQFLAMLKLAMQVASYIGRCLIYLRMSLLGCSDSESEEDIISQKLRFNKNLTKLNGAYRSTVILSSSIADFSGEIKVGRGGWSQHILQHF